jgi:hypothetical protein
LVIITVVDNKIRINTSNQSKERKGTGIKAAPAYDIFWNGKECFLSVKDFNILDAINNLENMVKVAEQYWGF